MSVPSEITITHIPTGIIVRCDSERSQHKNRKRALSILKAKLYMLTQDDNGVRYIYQGDELLDDIKVEEL